MKHGEVEKGLLKMIDFEAAKANLKKRTAEHLALPQKPPERSRVNHLIDYHLAEMNDWEETFIYSCKEWLAKAPKNYLSVKQLAKITEMEDSYCGQMCHALNVAGVKHG